MPHYELIVQIFIDLNDGHKFYFNSISLVSISKKNIDTD